MRRDLLVDLGSERFEPATVKAVRGGDGGGDPFANAFGFVRLDGSVGGADRRGELLQEFRADPFTQVCLLTKRSAGVGLNLTNANFVCLLEPSKDAAEELQCTMRVHRIGQTRPCTVLKFYTKGSIDERILQRRMRRGEIADSRAANIMAAAAAADDGPDSKSVMGWGDVKVLLGME